MTRIHLKVTGAKAKASVTGPLTSGMVGIPVTIEYDDAWEGLTKNLVCRCSDQDTDSTEQRAILNVGSAAVVAHEVMQAGAHLYLGLEGFRPDGELVIPTTWAMCGVIREGANTGEDLSADPTLPVWNQLQVQIEQLECGTFPQEQLEEIRACAEAAARSEENALAASERAAENADETRTVAHAAQIYMESARTSATSAANMANDALRYQLAAEAAAERAEATAGASQNLGLTVETISNDIEVIGVESISLDYSTIELASGGTMMLACMVFPANATNTAIRWESADESVATVDNGLVTAVGGGNTVITAISEDNPNARVQCAVAVATGENTVYFASLDMQNGMYNKDGTLNSGIHGHYIIPYIEGMEIHTVQSGMFAGNGYLPFFVRNKSTGALTKVEGYTSEDCSDFPIYQTTYSHFSVSLSGYNPAEVEVVVNAYKASEVGSGTVSKYKDYYKYSYVG